MSTAAGNAAVINAALRELLALHAALPYLCTTLVLAAAGLWLCFGGDGAGTGNGSSLAQWAFTTYVRLGRLRNVLCAPVNRALRRYPVAATCQVPFFHSIGDVYAFVFGYRTHGTFVEVGAYDGESFSNTR
jgi:hypothetical protein